MRQFGRAGASVSRSWSLLLAFLGLNHDRHGRDGLQHRNDVAVARPFHARQEKHPGDAENSVGQPDGDRHRERLLLGDVL